MLQSANPGLMRRFQNTLNFPDWSSEDCAIFLQKMAEGEGYRLDEAAKRKLRHGFREAKSRPVSSSLPRPFF